MISHVTPYNHFFLLHIMYIYTLFEKSTKTGSQITSHVTSWYHLWCHATIFNIIFWYYCFSKLFLFLTKMVATILFIVYIYIHTYVRPYFCWSSTFGGVLLCRTMPIVRFLLSRTLFWNNPRTTQIRRGYAGRGWLTSGSGLCPSFDFSNIMIYFLFAEIHIIRFFSVAFFLLLVRKSTLWGTLLQWTLWIWCMYTHYIFFFGVYFLILKGQLSEGEISYQNLFLVFCFF